jgi:hypothetical protein
MAYELKDGQGSLFKNDRKESENHPDYRGEINVDGQLYWLSAWIKEGKKGKFMSLSAKPKDDIGSNSKPPKEKLPGNMQDMDDEIPFANPYKGRLSYVV